MQQINKPGPLWRLLCAWCVCVCVCVCEWEGEREREREGGRERERDVTHSSCAGSRDWLSGKQLNWRVNLEKFWRSQERIMFRKLPKLDRAYGWSCTFTNKGEWCYALSLNVIWLHILNILDLIYIGGCFMCFCCWFAQILMPNFCLKTFKLVFVTNTNAFVMV